MPRTRSTRASMRRPARGRGTPLTSTRATRGANRTAVERSSATVSPHAESLTSTDQPLSTLTLNRFLSMVREEVRAELQESQTQVIAQDSNMPTVLPQHQPAQVLGNLPPPTSLTSVPLINTARPTFDHFLPSTTTGVTWANSAPIPQSNPHHLSLLPTASAQSGLVLSPAAEPIPQRLVHKIRSGNFVEMKELLADNLALISQLESVPGTHPMHLLGATRPRLREVTTLASWCYCFLGYMAVRTTDSGTRDQLAYARLLIKEAQRHGGQGCLDYDRAFRQQAATDPTISWNTLNAGLQASTILGAPPTVHGQGQGMFCTLCRGVDHTRSQCALACLQPTPTSVPPLSRGAATRRRPETLGQARICISWNRGACTFQGGCTYRHICATCQTTQHRARDCPRTPETSIFKRPPRTVATTTVTSAR